MFIITAKLDRRKVIGGALILVVLVAAAILLLGGWGGSQPAAKLSAVVKNNEQRINYLKSLGWEVGDKPLEEQSITIPRDFGKVYADYNELQLSQGFDLKKYSGLDATRYTYEIKNHPTASGPVVADMIVYRGEVIAADVQAIDAKNGFMNGIAFPAT